MDIDLKELEGNQYGELTAMGPVYKNCLPTLTWRFRCSCGRIIKTRLSWVLNGKQTSCGCKPWDPSLVPEVPVRLSPYTYNRLYGVWSRILTQTRNPRYISYPRYGGRGIRVCVEWMSFDTFRDWALSAGYVDGDGKTYTLRRKDDSRDFMPENCYWQVTTGSCARKVGEVVRVKGESHTIIEWAGILQINPCSIYTARKKGIAPWLYIRYRLEFPSQLRPRPARIQEYALEEGWEQEPVYE